jgi:hypothetical protein
MAVLGPAHASSGHRHRRSAKRSGAGDLGGAGGGAGGALSTCTPLVLTAILSPNPTMMFTIIHDSVKERGE